MSRFYGSIEDANRAAARRVSDLRRAAGYIPAVREVIRQFDGKVYNCRFDKAIAEATGRAVHVRKDGYNFSIYAYPEGNYSFHITLASIRSKELADGKRIPADKLIESLRVTRESLLSRAYETESGIESMPQVKAYIEETREKLESYLRKIPSDLAGLYGLPRYVRLD